MQLRPLIVILALTITRLAKAANLSITPAGHATAAHHADKGPHAEVKTEAKHPQAEGLALNATAHAGIHAEKAQQKTNQTAKTSFLRAPKTQQTAQPSAASSTGRLVKSEGHSQGHIDPPEAPPTGGPGAPDEPPRDPAAAAGPEGDLNDTNWGIRYSAPPALACALPLVAVAAFGQF
ncbi:unnamed protein product [Vitrella brassicaformis CCMP3155]|uniref:Uncharacterized protein n=1 Tax=Vitrella brassicaformis (strain CCMP3155) TaxID=1169540 RepID=A0A0G4EX07_VITBC|nr:unnamed protein product [Vitrella brassicaformis CCMP3155]|mmetsp:Transcript_23171/g.57318  ORF Transcript_23171/g.57318 Transcript_23171/m.57318 type:complete len:178 (-) Transcript_23171:402-935(-)|eukprot:CEM03313.1 unnamed protein product [Vitrella brassicaformis CCMP3155]